MNPLILKYIEMLAKARDWATYDISIERSHAKKGEETQIEAIQTGFAIITEVWIFQKPGCIATIESQSNSLVFDFDTRIDNCFSDKRNAMYSGAWLANYPIKVKTIDTTADIAYIKVTPV